SEEVRDDCHGKHESEDEGAEPRRAHRASGSDRVWSRGRSAFSILPRVDGAASPPGPSPMALERGRGVRPALPGQLLQGEVGDLGDGGERIVEGVELIQLQIGGRVDVPLADSRDPLGMLLQHPDGSWTVRASWTLD